LKKKSDDGITCRYISLKKLGERKNAEFYAIALLNAKFQNKYYMHSLGKRWPVMLQKNPTCNFF
jgi:hypothetical protein